MNGKGSKQRPRQVSHADYDKRWRDTFGEKPCKCTGLGSFGCPAHGRPIHQDVMHRPGTCESCDGLRRECPGTDLGAGV